MLNYGTFELMPAVWNGGNFGYVRYGDDAVWRKIPIAEIHQRANTMTKAKFDAAFPDLPPLPAELKPSP